MTTDSLRERIREILWRELEYDGEDFCGHVADVLIRELGLEPQAHYDPGCDHYRYVTDWISPDQSSTEKKEWGCGDERCKACY